MDLKEALHTSGQRYTRQREAVYRALQQCGRHPTADEVYGIVRREIPHISLATVYKALESLVSAGLAGRIPGADGPTRYDRSAVPHLHLRRHGTGEVFDVPMEIQKKAVSVMGTDLAARIRREMQFEVTAVNVEILGDFIDAKE